MLGPPGSMSARESRQRAAREHRRSAHRVLGDPPAHNLAATGGTRTLPPAWPNVPAVPTMVAPGREPNRLFPTRSIRASDRRRTAGWLLTLGRNADLHLGQPR